MDRVSERTVQELVVRRYESRGEMGAAAAAYGAALLQRILAEKDGATVIFAAAPSQNELLHELCQAQNVDWSRVTAYHMDEYVGLGSDDPKSFGAFLRNAVFDKLPFHNVHLIRGNAPDAREECDRYAGQLPQGDVDLVFLGIGENGHLAFNDPPVADFHDAKDVKVVELDAVCRMQQVHDGCFDSLDDVPAHAITLTIPRLLRSTYRICVVPGRTKAAAVRDMLQGEISAACPASILRAAKGTVLFLDADSSSMLD